MDSDNEEDQPGFPKQGGDALDLDDDDGGFAPNDSEEVDEGDDDDDEDMVMPDQMPEKKGSGSKVPPLAAGPPKDVKGDKLENQPYDLAVDVNDSEEIESDEEEDEVNMNDVGRNQ